MFALNRILLPVDFVHDEQSVLEYARTIAGNSDAQFHLVHVQTPGQTAGISDAEQEDEGASAELRTAELIAHAKQMGMNCDGRVMTGGIPEAILEAANELDADCILLASGGRAAQHRVVWGGSTYGALIGTSEIPVLVLPPRFIKNDGIAAARIPRTIVCPVDDTPYSMTALLAAADLARFYEAELVVVHVAKQERDDRTAALEEKEVRELVGERVNVRFIATTGKTRNIVLETVESSSADLIVIASQGRTRLAQLFAPSFAQSLVTYVECPVLTFGPESVSTEVEATVVAEKERDT